MTKEKPLQSGKGFESLGGFKASKEPLPYSSLYNTQAEAGNISRYPQEPLSNSGSQETDPKDVELKEAGLEDSRIVNGLVTLINQQTLKLYNNNFKNAKKYLLALNHGNTQKYCAIVRLVTASRTRDVSYEIDRWLSSDRGNQEINEICTTLLLRGYKSQALSWIRSLGVEGMKYGTVPKNSKPTYEEKRSYRIEQAKVWAEKAKTTIEVLAAENNLANLLNG